MSGNPPWERQTDESAPAFEAFATYRDMGADRSTRKTADRLSKSKTLMGRWSGRHAWVRRVESWERELDRRWRAEQAAARREVARRHARMASAFQSKVLSRLQNIDPNELSAGELLRWFDAMVRIERQAYDLDGTESRDAGPAEARSMLRNLMDNLRAGDYGEEDEGAA